MRWLFLVILVLHALIHLMGFVQAFGYADLPQLKVPLTKVAGVGWLAAALLLLVAALMFIVWPSTWWIAALLGIVVSQVVIAGSWSDAKFGTLGNAIVLVAALHGFASRGPVSLHAEYRHAVTERLVSRPSLSPLLDADLDALPPPVACYVRKSGAVGQNRVHDFKAQWRGRIRGGIDEPWMQFSAEQYNFVSEPARFFFMNAERSGLPVDVLHAFQNGDASMRVRLLSLVPIVDARGPEATRAETVTLLNDLCVLVPGALVDPALSWQPIDEHSARAIYTLGPNTVSAVLEFNEDCELVDFVSDDRMVALDGNEFVRQRWSTPLANYRAFGPYHLASQGEGRWHPATGDYAYIELELTAIHVNGIDAGTGVDESASSVQMR